MNLPCGCDLEYQCSRCKGCYIHEHHTILVDRKGIERWYWFCHRTLMTRKLIFEKSPYERGYKFEGISNNTIG